MVHSKMFSKPPLLHEARVLLYGKVVQMFRVLRCTEDNISCLDAVYFLNFLARNMVWILLLVIMRQAHGFQSELVVINEVSIATNQQIETHEFIELKFTDLCMFKRLRNSTSLPGPSLKDYYLLQIVRFLESLEDTTDLCSPILS